MLQIKLLFCVLLVGVFAVSTTNAQPPQYYLNTVPPAFATITWRSPTVNDKYQSIYNAGLFPTAKSGQMTSVYLRAGSVYTTGACAHDSIQIRMGYVNRDTFSTNLGTKADSFYTELTTVYFIASTNYKYVDSSREWIKFPLNRGNFFYSPGRSFVVEFTGKGKVLYDGFDLMLYNPPFIGHRTLAGLKTDAVSKISNADVLEFGFDIMPTGVDKLTNIQSFGVFPNPNQDGRFNVSFDAIQDVKNVRIAATDAIGRAVYETGYNNTGNKFFKRVDMSGAGKGIYFMKVWVDGELVTRRVIIQ